jgi:hypothetical protein
MSKNHNADDDYPAILRFLRQALGGAIIAALLTPLFWPVIAVIQENANKSFVEWNALHLLLAFLPAWLVGCSLLRLLH